MKSKYIYIYMAGTFTKKNCKQSFVHNNVKVWPKMTDIVNGVCSDISAWPGREKENISEKMALFGIKTTDMIKEANSSGLRGSSIC